MYRFFRNLAFATAILAAPASADEWPVALKTALEEPKNGATYSYKLRVEWPGETFDHVFEAFIDPSRPPEERIEILSRSPRTESSDLTDLLDAIKEGAPEDIWCSSVADTIPKDVVLAEETADTLVFNFRPIAGQDMPKEDRKLFKKLKGQIVIDKKTMTVRSYRLTNRKHIRIMFVARLRTWLLEMECALAPNGRSYRFKDSFTTEVGVFGNRTIYTFKSLISDLTPIQMSVPNSERSF